MPFRLAPALALEAEDFTIQKGWKVLKNGEGNYMVDIIGFNHISGERLLALDAHTAEASAYQDVVLPETGDYRLWARYEYPPFSETRFRVIVEQGGKRILDQVMGKKDSPRYGFGEQGAKAQHDPAWGSEGLMEEVVTVRGLQKGKARILLQGVEQAEVGVSAARHLDLIYLTRDTSDTWRGHYGKSTRLYPILDAFRDTRGPRWEVRLTNRGDRLANFRITHTYNRIPWGRTDSAEVRGLLPGATSAWVGLADQDTAHFGLTTFNSSAGAFDLELRPAPTGEMKAKANTDSKAEHKFSGASPLHIYLPPYPSKGERPTTPQQAIEVILADLAKNKPLGKKPTLPLCYGGWLPLGQDNDYGRSYAKLYATLGFRSLHPAHSGPKVLENLEAVGIPRTQSWMVTGYRNPPTRSNIDKAKIDLNRRQLTKELLWYDYGDEIHFSEWLGQLINEEVAEAKAKGLKVTGQQILTSRWLTWLKDNRGKTNQPREYWLDKWGPFNGALMRPDSSAEAARLNPRLYVDSLLFYEETAIRYVAAGAKLVRETLGEHVRCGANYSCHPFYYPHSTMYIKWFRGGAADLGRHSEYFWQVTQAGPMINGYLAEHFRAGMRDNPRAVLRQYTMPHAPGNTDGNFLRSAFTHLAHGATALDFFGIGLNESFTENHIDHRAVGRYRALRDITHAVGFVEDLLPASRPVPSPVALLISESTERWDHAGTATDLAGHAHFGPAFRSTRLHFHLDRLGLWKAFTFLGVSPDLVSEEDLDTKVLDNYKVLVLVGDSLPSEKVAKVENWVRRGGTVLATAGAGRYDAYRSPIEGWTKLFGLSNRVLKEETTFLRPRQELAFLKPMGRVFSLNKPGWEMPVLASREVPIVDVKSAKNANDSMKILARFASGEPAVTERTLEKGRIVYVAVHPGLASLWSALQPPTVPDRGPNTHSIPTGFDVGARQLLEEVLRSAAVEPLLKTDPSRIDGRLLEAPKGYLVPLSNYEATVGQKVRVAVRVGRPIRKVISAQHGEIPAQFEEGRLTFTVPALGYGDIVRLEP